MTIRPHIVMVIPRGEAVRNFLYSETLPCLSTSAHVTLLSVVDDPFFSARFGRYVDRVITLKEYQENLAVKYLRKITHDAHFRWQWSEVAQNRWEMFDARFTSPVPRLARKTWKTFIGLLANRTTLEALTNLEQETIYRLRPTREFDRLFRALKPDLVFNGSHIHGPAGDLPLNVAHKVGIMTAGFIFSWDNLTSRSRITTPYDFYLVWHNQMHDQLLEIYPNIKPEQVFVTGTPQFDFHHRPEYRLSREELCAYIGVDPARQFVLYTTGIPKHFPEEHRMVRLVAELLQQLPLEPKPQLVVRTYAKGVSSEMKALANENLPDVIFPPTLWNEKWFMPLEEDLAIYTSLLLHTALGINVASTVSLELMMFDKPVINLDFNPPGTNLPKYLNYHRHIAFDHYKAVAESGASMVARSIEDMRAMLYRGLTEPEADSNFRCEFIASAFGATLDGHAGERIANLLIELANKKKYIAEVKQ